MHIVVCVKQIPNPEAAFSMLKVDEQAKKVVPAPGLQLVMSPFDEQAMEAALRVRDDMAEAKITAISVGPESARSVLKHALAMGADQAVLVKDATLEDGASEATAFALAHAIDRVAPFDLILAGRQSADADAGVVGSGVAELLRLPIVTFARKLEVSGDTVRVERVLADGFETIEASLPVVVTVSNELGAPRPPSLRETMRAARKPLEMRSAADVGIEPEALARFGGLRVRERLFVPQKNTRCDVIAGADETVKARELARRLREAQLI